MLEQQIQTLGSLEYEVMSILWNKNSSSARDIHQQIMLERNIAYTTVMTTLSRMAKKGIVEQIQQTPRKFFYRPSMSRLQFLQIAIKQLEDKFETLSTERQQMLVAMIRLWDKLDASQEERQQVALSMKQLWDKLDVITADLHYIGSILHE